MFFGKFFITFFCLKIIGIQVFLSKVYFLHVLQAFQLLSRLMMRLKMV